MNRIFTPWLIGVTAAACASSGWTPAGFDKAPYSASQADVQKRISQAAAKKESMPWGSTVLCSADKATCFEFLDGTLLKRSKSHEMASNPALKAFEEHLEGATAQHGTPTALLVFSSKTMSATGNLNCGVISKDATYRPAAKDAQAFASTTDPEATAALKAGTLCASAFFGSGTAQRATVLLSPRPQKPGSYQLRYLDWNPDSAVQIAYREARMKALKDQRKRVDAVLKKVDALLDAPGPSCSKGHIKSVIGKNRASVRACYEQQLKQAPSLKGELRVSFTIQADGTVTGTSFSDSSTIANTAMRDCVKGVVDAMTFDKPAGGGVCKVSYPFVFVSP